MENNQLENAYLIAKQGYKYGKSKEYFKALYKAIIREMMKQGFCEYLDSFYFEGTRGINPIEMSVLYCIQHYYETGESYKVEGSEYIPEIQVSNYNYSRWIRWDERKAWENSKINGEEIYSVLRNIILNGRKQHLNYICKLKSELKKASSEDKNEILQMKDKAREEALQIKDEAREEALRIKNEASEEAQQIKNEVREEALQIKDEAKKWVEDRKKEQSEEALKLSDKLVERNIAKAQVTMRQELIKELESYREDGKNTAKKMDEHHAQMCKETNQLQGQWVTALDETYAKLNELKSEFYKTLHSWQTSLYPSEYRPIAERYIELYRILNLDKMIRKEILSQESQENKKEETQRIEIEENKTEEKEAEEDISETIKGLEKLNTTLTRFLKKFEQSLSGLGLHLYFPEEGEEFDEILHVNNNEEIDPYGLSIKQCITPGIMKAGQFGDDVVIQAVVTVE